MWHTICFSRQRFTYTTGFKLCSKAAKGTHSLQSSVRVNWSQSVHSVGTSCCQSHSHPARLGSEGGVHEPTIYWWGKRCWCWSELLAPVLLVFDLGANLTCQVGLELNNFVWTKIGSKNSNKNDNIPSVCSVM